MSNNTIAIIGAGGHGKVVASTLISSESKKLIFYDDDPDKWGKILLGFSVQGPIEKLNGTGTRSIIAIGDNQIRSAIIKKLSDIIWVRVIHQTAILTGSISFGEGTLICAGTVIQSDAQIGSHVILNTSSSVDHDCIIEDFVHIAPGVHLAGDVRIGEGTLIGIGATVAPGISIGKWSKIGAGSTVLHNIPDGATAVGTPAKIIQK